MRKSWSKLKRYLAADGLLPFLSRSLSTILISAAIYPLLTLFDVFLFPRNSRGLAGFFIVCFLIVIAWQFILYMGGRTLPLYWFDIHDRESTRRVRVDRTGNPYFSDGKAGKPPRTQDPDGVSLSVSADGEWAATVATSTLRFFHLSPIAGQISEWNHAIQLDKGWQKSRISAVAANGESGFWCAVKSEGRPLMLGTVEPDGGPTWFKTTVESTDGCGFDGAVLLVLADNEIRQFVEPSPGNSAARELPATEHRVEHFDAAGSEVGTVLAIAQNSEYNGCVLRILSPTATLLEENIRSCPTYMRITRSRQGQLEHMKVLTMIGRRLVSHDLRNPGRTKRERVIGN